MANPAPPERTAASAGPPQPAPRAPRTRTVRPPASQVRLRAEQLAGTAPPPAENAADAPAPATELTASPATSQSPVNDEADQQTVRYVADRIVGAIATGRYESALAEIEALTLRQRGLLLEDYARRNNSNYYDPKSNEPRQNLWDYVKQIVRSGLTSPGFARVIAVLRGLPSRHHVSDLAEGLISKKSDETNLTEQINKIPQESRKAIIGLYSAFYDNFGIGNDTQERALYEHIYASLKKDIPTRRVYALLDHPVTAAEQLWYAAGSSASADEHAALTILLGELSKGADALGQLRADWKAYVQDYIDWLPGVPSRVGDLETTLKANLSSSAGEILDLLIELRRGAIHLENDARAEQDPAEKLRLGYKSAQRDLFFLDKVAQVLEPGLFSFLFASDKSERKALATQGRILQARAEQARQALVAQSQNQSQAQAAIDKTDVSIDDLRRLSSAPVTHTVAIADLAADSREAPEYELLAQQSESLADEVYFLATQKPPGYSAELVKKVTTIWLDQGKLLAFVQQARTPVQSRVTGQILRPAYDPSSDLLLDEPYLLRFLVSVAAKFDPIERGAKRLQLELLPGGDAALSAVYALLRDVPADTRLAIVSRFLFQQTGLPPSKPSSVGEDFRFYYLERNFTRSEVGTRLVNLLSGPATDLETAGQQADERERDTERPALRFLGTAVSRVFFNGEGNELSLAAAQGRFANFNRLKQENPQAFADLLSFYGVHSEAELTMLLSSDFDQRLLTREGGREAAAGVIEQFLTLVTRSALVVALGPTGLPGLLASLGGFVTGFLAHSAISGPGYDLFSRVNLATLLEEVAATVFEVAKIEDLIGQTVKLAYSSVPPQRAASQIAILSGILKSQGTKVLEKGIGNAVAGVDLPTFQEFVGKYFLANFIVATGKTKFSPNTLAGVNIETEFLRRLPLAIGSVAVHGPPPGAAFARAVVSDLIKLLATTPLDQLNTDRLLRLLQERAAWSAVFAVSVGTAQSLVAAATAQETLQLAANNPSTTNQLLRNQVVVKERGASAPFGPAYDRYLADTEAAGGTPVSGLAFLRDRTLFENYNTDAAGDRSALLKALDNLDLLKFE